MSDDDDDSDDTEPKDEQSPFVSVAEAAAYLRLARRTLDNMRWIGGGPRYRKHGGRVYYHRDDLKAWSESRAFKSTSER